MTDAEKEKPKTEKTKKTTKHTRQKKKEEKKKPEDKKRVKKTTKRKKAKAKIVIARGKRKEAIARATLMPGTGKIVINKIPIEALQNKYIISLIKEPVMLIGSESAKVDIKVNVRGGGMLGQAQAARTAIARGLVAYFESEEMEKTFLSHDPSLIIEDVRRVEPKKYKGPKARARFQKSYR